ncbi:DUF4190 domain-containing protein [Naasia aerilata]|uniref:DUF4190 domain-containing protein n=1 Tax=Naasia aerilata TaxID=1162966 RepID=A0ABN6XJ91_9MICO|nr:DUF4190 domain-containing protein [Naasia aerilata]BDZ44983.1 hypothetical protein GCM10025866_08920 [Naasia aerilata]
MTDLPQLYAPAPSAQPVAATPLSLAALLTGIGGIVFGWAFLGLPSIAAVVLGHLALRREADGRRLALPGLILGYVGIAGAVLLVVLIVASLTLPFLFLGLYPRYTGL